MQQTLVLWAVWNALKFIIMGPVSLILLIRARIAEAVARRGGRRDGDAGESVNHAAAEPLPRR